MALTDDEKSLLEKLTAKSKESDADDFEIEVYDTGSGKGARLPFSRGSKWLLENLGIGDAPDADEDEGKSANKQKKDPEPEKSSGYFGRGNSSK